MPASSLISYAHVGKSFDGGRGANRVVAVDDVSLDIAEGEFLRHRRRLRLRQDHAACGWPTG